MEITSYYRSQITKHEPCMESWAVAIRDRYGKIDDLLKRFNPNTQRACAKNMAAAFERDVPTLVRLIRTYGQDGVAYLMQIHLTHALNALGEVVEFTPEDVENAAEVICECDDLLTLKFTTVLGFFFHLRTGAFNIYGKINNRKIFEVLHKYADKAAAEEAEQYRKLEKERQRAELEQHDRSAISWEQFAAKHNLEGDTLQEHIAIQSEKAGLGREIAEFFEILRGFFDLVGDPKVMNAV